MQGKQITVVTNSVQHAANLVDLELATIILGGTESSGKDTHTSAGFVSPDQ